MKTKIVRIGNSRGVRIPKPLLEEAGLEDEVELRVVDSSIVIESAQSPRRGWEAAAAELHARDEDRLLDEAVPTAFDESEWVCGSRHTLAGRRLPRLARSVVLDQLRTIDRSRLVTRVGRLTAPTLSKALGVLREMFAE